MEHRAARSGMGGLAAVLLGSIVAMTTSACGSPPPPAAPSGATPGTSPASSASSASSAPRASRGEARAAFPAGLVPCAKDAPAGEGCSTGKPAAQAAPGGPVDDQPVWKVPVGPDDPARGAAEPLVTVVVFSDFECPFCKSGTALLARILEAYPNDVREVWKDLPLPMHEHAEAAAELARTARAQQGDAGFWAAHDLLYAAQPAFGEKAFHAIADQLKLPWPDVRAAIRTARFGAIIRKDVLLSDVTDVPATPTLFVNGRKVVGAQPYEVVKAVVDAELERARAAVARGTPRATLYGTIIAAGRQIAPPADAPSP